VTLTDGTVHTTVRYQRSVHRFGIVARHPPRLQPLRERWIAARNDTIELDRPPSLYRRGREAMSELDIVRFPSPRLPRRAKLGGNVTQMHYAARGEITPEMEFVALARASEPEFVRGEIARGRAILPSTSTTRKRADDHRSELPGEDQCQHRQLGVSSSIEEEVEK